MEMLLYQSTQFRDVKKILDRAHGFAGLLTVGGIEASRLDVPFVCDQKVLSRYDDACSDVRRILGELPQPFNENRFVPVCHGNASFLSFSLSYAQKSISFTVACRNFLIVSQAFTFLRPKVHRFYSGACKMPDQHPL